MPFRIRKGAGWDILRAAAIIVGLNAMVLRTMPEAGFSPRALDVVLWSVLALLAADWAYVSWRDGEGSGWWRRAPARTWLAGAVTVLAVPLALAIGIEPPTAWLLATLWLFKLTAHSPGLERLGRVLANEARPLASVLMLFVIVLFFAAVALHLAERGVQPAAFGNLPNALWWAVATLTTTGYGDVVPLTMPGRFIAGLVMICGLGVFGLLTGILATGFVEDSRRHNFVQNWQIVKSVPFFQSLDPAAIIELSRMLRRWDVSEGTAIVRRGREGDCMYFVATGEVEVEVQPPVRLQPGAFFGEGALLGNGTRNATVTSVMPTTLLVLEVADFRTFMAHHPSLSQAIEDESRKRAAAARGRA